MKTLAITLLLAIPFLSFAGENDSTNLQKLPDIIVKNSDGENVNLADFGKNGKITVISFWATWCKPCIKELRNMNDLLPDWEEEYGVELVAISVDDARNVPRVRPFAVGQGWDFTILLDPNADVQRLLNVTNPPVTILIDADGNIVDVHTGYLEGDEYALEEKIIALVAKGKN